jgi:hypothetical protein
METSDKAEKQGSMFDEAMRTWAQSSPARLAAWLDPSVAGLPAGEFVLHSSELNDSELRKRVIRPDLVVGVGSQRIMHVEYETSPRANLAHRMLKYLDRLMDDHPGRRITQHVIVLRDGWVRGHDELSTRGFALDLKPVYLREHAPDEYLSDPFLALFAALARGSPAVREQSLAAAIKVVENSGHPMSWVWLPSVISLAEVRLAGSTIDRVEKEGAMSVDAYVRRFQEHRWGQALMSKGREEGREEGVLQGGERVLLETIRMRFGDSPAAEEAAHLLGGWDDVAAALTAINAARDTASLLDQIRESPC